jgi:hypothetical protein
MPVSDCAVPSRPRVSTDLPLGDIGDYTFTRELAREWLNCTQAELDELVRRSRLNRSRGITGPLELVNGSFSLRSVFACRRLLVTSTH